MRKALNFLIILLIITLLGGVFWFVYTPDKYNTSDIDEDNYLTPIFPTAGITVSWYYNPLTLGTAGERSVWQQYLKYKDPNISFSNFRLAYFGTEIANTVLNRNTKIISSSLYAPATSSATIGKKGIDPTKPEYYTPTGSSVNWTYKASRGVSDVYAKLISNDKNINTAVKTLVVSSTDSTPGENTNISQTNITGSKIDVNKDLFTLNGSEIANKTSLGSGQNTTFGNSGITDFRSGSFIGVNGKSLVPSTDYTIFSRENKYNTSQTSFKGNWKFVGEDGSEGVRVTDPNEGISSDGDGGFIDPDLAAFSFTVVSPSETVDINFRAYIESWSDGFKGEWSPIKYMGRAESFYKYNGFSRDSSITFLVPTLSKLDLAKNYTKLNDLINSVLPSYSPISTAYTSGLMRGSITYVGMGDYFYLVPSIIKSIDYQEIEGMGWDIDRKEDGTRTGLSQQLPKGIKVTVNFTPVHDFTPQFGETFIGI
jgi:hypothetical protein